MRALLFVATLLVFGWLACRPYDVLGLCPMALDEIKIDTGVPGFEKALVSWRNFAAEYRCGP